MDESELRQLLAQGETETIEFKSSYPATARDLAKEIAALASTNGGSVLLGVDDQGNIVGIPLTTDADRKALKERVEGLCSQAIAPPVSVTVEHVRCSEGEVVAIRVPESRQEVHYVNGRPYIRCMSISRVATPQEVKEKIIIGDILQRIRELETQSRGVVASGIEGQGELATMNRDDLLKYLSQRQSRRLP